MKVFHYSGDNFPTPMRQLLSFPISDVRMLLTVLHDWWHLDNLMHNSRTKITHASTTYSSKIHNTLLLSDLLQLLLSDLLQ